MVFGKLGSYRRNWLVSQFIIYGISKTDFKDSTNFVTEINFQTNHLALYVRYHFVHIKIILTVLDVNDYIYGICSDEMDFYAFRVSLCWALRVGHI